jgi:hypothetical protein
MSEDPSPMSDDRTGKVYEAHLSRDDSVGPIYFISPFPPEHCSDICEISTSLRLKTTMSYISRRGIEMMES